MILCRTHILLLLCLCLQAACSLCAQTYTAGRESYMTWEEFAAEYMAEYTEEDPSESGTRPIEQLERLEELHAAPLNINTADRADLLRIPFLSESQVDSLLSYRERKRIFLSLGELMFIHDLPYADRRRLSLFVYAGDTLRLCTPLVQRLTRGKHELNTRIDLPLYKRAGFAAATASELQEHPNRYYMGGNWGNTVRYRYRHPSGIAYGMTLQNDVGEPWGRHGNNPYDYISAYAAFATIDKRLKLWLGDYEVHAGEGLLAANSFYHSSSLLLSTLPRNSTTIRPHTGTDEDRYFRGIAAEMKFDSWSIMAFGSWRQIDARLENDSAVTLYTNGLHRTPTELQHRRNLNLITAGTHAVFNIKHGHIGGTFMFDHYTKPLAPPLRDYNRYYMRGQTAVGISTDFRLKFRPFTLQGELATDRKGHIATSHTLRYEPRPYLSLTAQGRYFSPRYVAPHADAMRQASRTQNEAGLMVGLTYRPTQNLETQGYFDYAHFFRPTYYAAIPHTHSFSAFLRTKYTLSPTTFLQLNYTFKTKQKNITGHTGLVEYNTTHRLRLSANYNPSDHLSLYAAADAVFLTTQTASLRTGKMLSSRSTWQCTPHLKTSLFAAAFFTDDYATRLFAYEPLLRYSGLFPSYAYHGFKLANVTTWDVLPTLQIAARFSLLHYFNRSQISSGAQLIDASSQNDLSLQVIWRP